MEKNFIIYSLVGFTVILLFVGVFGIFGIGDFILPEETSAATSTTVTVSASVTAALSCSTNVTATALGTLTDASISTASPNASTTMSCTNSSAGCTLYINDSGNGTDGGLWNSTSSALVESPNASFSASSTLAAGTEGYGIRATTTTSGSGGILGVATRYNIVAANGLAGSANDVGGLTTSTKTLASSTAAVTGREMVVTHKAAVATATPGGTYDDTITYSCLGN